MKTWLTLAVLIFYQFNLFVAFARLDAPNPQFTVKTQKKGSKKLLFISVTPPDHHHFNVNAPLFIENKITKQQTLPIYKSIEKIEFILSKMSESYLTLYLCDDANKYCIKKELPLTQ